jgi:alkaline phosphatase D
MTGGDMMRKLMGRRGFGALMASAMACLPFTAFARPSKTGTYRLMNGPMLGAPAPDAMTIWMRTSAPVPVIVEYGTDPALRGALRSRPLIPSAQEDFVVKLPLGGLQPGTRYYYRILLDGAPDRYLEPRSPFSFTTAPAVGAPGKYRIAFGSCARIQLHPHQPIWNAVERWSPDMFLWLGDNVYLDTLEPMIMADMYQWQRAVPELQPLLRSVPQLAIWDDHDYALNDSDRTNPVKAEALQAFSRYWANPGGGLDHAPGVFFKQSYGDVDIFMLDGRWYRDPVEQADGPGKSMIGEAQMQWLCDNLKSSRATFKLLAIGSSWTLAKGPQGDAWSAYLHERDTLFDFIAREAIEGVILLSGDSHAGELNAIPWSERGGYDLYELVSSPLAQGTRTDWLEYRPEIRIRQVFVGGNNFGAIEIDTTASPARISLGLVGESGNRMVNPVELDANDLRPNSRSWDREIDEVSLQRLNAQRAGRDYYALESTGN